MSTDLDCTRCGACCFGTHPKYIQLLPADQGRVLPAEVTRDIDGQRFMAMCGGHCAQLTPTADERLVCAVYDNRPEACRAFRAGSFECGRARQHRLHLAEALRLPVAIAVPEAVTPLPDSAAPAVTSPGAPAGLMPPPREGQGRV